MGACDVKRRRDFGPISARCPAPHLLCWKNGEGALHGVVTEAARAARKDQKSQRESGRRRTLDASRYPGSLCSGWRNFLRFNELGR